MLKQTAITEGGGSEGGSTWIFDGTGHLVKGLYASKQRVAATTGQQARPRRPGLRLQ